MEYLAFDVVQDSEGAMYSRRAGSFLTQDEQGHYVLNAPLQGSASLWEASDLWGEANEWGVDERSEKMREDYIFLVSPVGDYKIYIDGWDASGYTVVAGPWKVDDADGMRQAAELILAAYRQGYPQVERALLWAASIVGRYHLEGEKEAFQIIQQQAASIYNAALAVEYAGYFGVRALPLVERALLQPSPDGRLQMAAVKSAGLIGTPALYILERAMQQCGCGLSCRLCAIEIAARIGTPALKILILGIEDNSEYVRAAAIQAAVQLGAGALQVLERAITSTDPHVASMAVNAAARLGVDALPGGRSGG